MNNGFLYNGIKYVRFGKSASQSKQGITVFVKEKIYNELMKISMLDIDMFEKEVCISKYEAYRCLIFSTCTLLDIPIPNIVIVDEYKKIIPNQKIKYVEEVEKIAEDGKHYFSKEIKDGYKDVSISPFDGCGIHSIDLSLKAQEEIGLDYIPIGLQIRLPFMKGYSVEFDFKQWFRENGITKIKDVLGFEHDIENVDCIWNTSMFKGFSIFKDKYGNQAINEYFKVLDKYEFKIGISKYSHHTNHINIKSRMNFQYLQCLDLINPKYVEHFNNLYNKIEENTKYNITNQENFGKILSFAQYSTDLFEKICSGSKFHMLKFLGVGNSEMDEVTSAYIKAVLINDTMLKDPSVKRMIKRKCQKIIDEMKLGKIYCNGFYHTVVGDIIGYLEYISDFQPLGVLSEKQFYCDTIFENGEDILSFRSPLVCPSEVNNITINKNLDTKWFGHFKGQDVVMLNMYDLSMPVQGGMDADGDAVLLCNDKIIVDSKIDKTMIIDIDDKVSAKKVIYNNQNITEYELNSRDERIGEITNIATSLLNKYTNSEDWNKIYEDNVSFLRILQGKEIDSIKTGVRWSIPKYLRNYLKKVPYFLLYNYPKKLNKYFRIRKENKSLEIKREKNAYNSPSPMNELCEYICRWEKEKLIWDKSEVNTGLLLINNNIVFDDKDILLEMHKINNNFSKEWKELLLDKNIYMNISLNQCLEKYREILLSIDLDRNVLANYFIKTCYLSNSINKTLCWYIFSDIMLDNLINNSPTEKSTLIFEDKEGNYEFLGKKYLMVEGE